MRETVVLVHGLWMSGWALAAQRHWIMRHGYKAVTFSYASSTRSLDENAASLYQFVRLQQAGKLSIVGHSLGGLLTLRMLALWPDERVKRVVLMGSPYTSSAAAEAMRRYGWIETLIGRTLLDWYASDRPDLGKIYEIGVIAGTRPFGLGTVLARLKPPSDGTVALSETILPTMSDRLVLPVTHTGMLTSKRVAHAVCSFLAHGKFDGVHRGRVS